MTHPPVRAYRILLDRYGPQGWWPVTPPGSASPVYRPGRRGPLTEREAFEVAVGAVLTQNTAWTNVARALEALHANGGLSPRKIGRMSRGRLQRLIRPSGYFRQKSIKLGDLAAAVRAHKGPGGPGLLRWLAGDLGRAREELLAVRGIGPETADSILLYAGGRDAFVIDAYTLRIGSRVGWLPAGTAYADAQARLAAALARLGKGARGRAVVYQEFHALLVRLAKLHCRTKPLCGACPLVGGCRVGKSAEASGRGRGL